MTFNLKLLKLAVIKYKLSNFAFLVLELFYDIINKQNNKKFIDIKYLYLKSLLPNHNILTKADSTFGYKHTEMIRLKLKTNYSFERLIQINILNRRKNPSTETINKIRAKS